MYRTAGQQRRGPTILHALDILFLSNYGPYLGRVTFTVTKVQHLLRYVSETVLAMASEWKSMENVEATYMRAQREILETSEDGAAGLEFFELLITGCASERMKEWLVDSLGDKGQKKWEKVFVNGYDTLRRLAHEHLLPACDRLIVLLSKLRGLARWTDKDSSLGLDPMDYNKLLDLVSGLMAICHEFIGKVNYELDLFSAFIFWLKSAYDEFNSLNEGNAPNPQGQDELPVDTLKVAEFIGKHLQNSILVSYFDKSEWTWKEGENVFQSFTKADAEGTSGAGNGGEPVSSLISGSGSGLKKRESSGSFTGIPGSQSSTDENPKPLPSFHQISTRMNEVSKSIFAKPANAMKQQVHVGQSIVVHNDSFRHLDIRLCDDGKEAIWYIAMSENELDEYGKPIRGETGSLIVIRIAIVKNGTLSSVSDVSCTRILLPKTKVISDLRFTDNETLLLLLYDADNTEMVNIRCTSPHFPYKSVPRSFWELPSPPTSKLSDTAGIFSYGMSLEPISFSNVKKRLTFNHNDITPISLTVNVNKGRRLGCVLDREKIRWIIFDLGPIAGEREDEEDTDEDEDEEGDSSMRLVQQDWDF
ncbi:hypothetical protein ABW19_dt0207714 [Dactylella cylindrospora]|nr:hypothetical protein ABW19_dt0207714 [Dactylella cylindrospora]